MTDFVFRDGRFSPLEFLPAVPDGTDGDEALRLAGFLLSQRFGDEFGFHYDLFEHTNELRWVVSVETCGRYVYVLCESWPDLIELLAKLSPTVVAAIFDEERLAAIHELLMPTIVRLESRRNSSARREVQ